jgi:tripartite-type tricarboxylate transporter receptor subunit TctC
LLAPAKTPRQDIAQIAGFVSAALAAPDIQAKLTTMNSYSVNACGADFGAYIKEEYEEIGRVIRESNLKAQ